MTVADIVNYGEEAVKRGDVYVWGANGEPLLDLLPKLVDMETSSLNVSKTLALISSNIKTRNCDIKKMRGCDCSGLWVKFLISNNIIKHDMTANGIYNFINNSVSKSKLQAGDFVFHRSSPVHEWSHIGLYIGNGYVIESKGRAYGVVKTKLDCGYDWNGFARPKWYSSVDNGKYTLTRKLYYNSKDMLCGDDVKHVQEKLKCIGLNVGTIDGEFGRKTEQAVIDFQTMNKLSKVSYGTVDAKTAKALGFNYTA